MLVRRLASLPLSRRIMANFISGLRLSEEFWQEAVAPILATDFPGVPYSAALLGSGSEVLSFDTEMSSDHHWGPRVMLFLREADHTRYHAALHRSLSQRLPRTFRGYPTNFTPPDPEDSGTQLLQAVDTGPINHRVDILTMRGFWLDYLNFDMTTRSRPSIG
jgi:hypothetical protein